MVLLNPGPVNVTDTVRRALLGPDICHREPEFSRLLISVRDRLLSLFARRSGFSVALFSGSGTTAVEAMMSSFPSPGRRVLVLSNGVYGERLKQILERRGASPAFLEAPIGDFPDKAAIRRALSQRSIEAVAMVHHETSSGTLNPLSDVSALAKRLGKYVLVDAVSSLGGESVDVSKLDLCAGTSGKCLHGVPGIAFVFVSPRAKAALAKRSPTSLTLDLKSALSHAESGDTAFTPAVQVLYALDQALRELSKEGLHARIARYRKLSALVTEGMQWLGVPFLVEDPRLRSHVLTALRMPVGISYDSLHDELKKRGFVIYAGQSTLKGRIFRVANLGAISAADIKRFLSHLKKILDRR